MADDDVMARLRKIAAQKFEEPTPERAVEMEREAEAALKRAREAMTAAPRLPEYVSPLDDPKFKAQMDEDLAAIRQSKREAIEREQEMLASLGTLAELAVRDHDEAAERQRVDRRRFWITTVFSAVAAVAGIVALFT